MRILDHHSTTSHVAAVDDVLFDTGLSEELEIERELI